MVNKIIKLGTEYHVCEACDMTYKEEEIAKKCEDWCNKNHSCNIEIIKHAVKK
tara:strand:- start:932 stop:1090 length:159 start_codon:yes stop_codon:yes gene_type:complete